MADGLGRCHQRRPDTASGRGKCIQTGRGDFREIPACAVLGELLPPPRLMLRLEEGCGSSTYHSMRPFMVIFTNRSDEINALALAPSPRGSQVRTRLYAVER